ncbi:MAG: hypothetical protein ABI340_02745 [Nitrososphaera sp.]|jgi:hypothetical protein
MKKDLRCIIKEKFTGLILSDKKIPGYETVHTQVNSISNEVIIYVKRMSQT